MRIVIILGVIWKVKYKCNLAGLETKPEVKVYLENTFILLLIKKYSAAGDKFDNVKKKLKLIVNSKPC